MEPFPSNGNLVLTGSHNPAGSHGSGISLKNPSYAGMRKCGRSVAESAFPKNKKAAPERNRPRENEDTVITPLPCPAQCAGTGTKRRWSTGLL